MAERGSNRGSQTGRVFWQGSAGSMAKSQPPARERRGRLILRGLGREAGIVGAVVRVAAQEVEWELSERQPVECVVGALITPVAARCGHATNLLHARRSTRTEEEPPEQRGYAREGCREKAAYAQRVLRCAHHV